MQKKKRLDIELMRILAAYFVIFNHTSNEGFLLFAQCDPHSVSYWWYLFLSVFCKFSVPVFFMISGALMLQKDSFANVSGWMKKIVHIIVILIVWSFFYYMFDVRLGREQFSISRFLSQVYESNWNYSYWYIYAYLAFLITLPLLQRLAQNLRNKDFLYIFMLYTFFMMILPTVHQLFWTGHSLNGSVSVAWLTSDLIIFPLAGYFLSHRLDKFWNRKKILLLWGVNVATIMLSCFLTYYKAKITGLSDDSSLQSFHYTFVLINAISIFATCQYLDEHTNVLKKLGKIITSFGECTFGVYLLHVYMMHRVGISGVWTAISAKLVAAPMLCALVKCALIFLCSYVVIWILRKIPFIRRLVL